MNPCGASSGKMSTYNCTPLVRPAESQAVDPVEMAGRSEDDGGDEPWAVVGVFLMAAWGLVFPSGQQRAACRSFGGLV
jgi:hypothetical protein